VGGWVGTYHTRGRSHRRRIVNGHILKLSPETHSLGRARDSLGHPNSLGRAHSLGRSESDRDPDRIEPQILGAPRIPWGAPIQNRRPILLCVALAIAVPPPARRAESVHKRQERQETVGETLVLRKGGIESNYVDGLDVGVSTPSSCVAKRIANARVCSLLFRATCKHALVMCCETYRIRARILLTFWCRAVPCRAMPCRAVPCRAVPCNMVL